MSDIVADRTLDARGLKCPMPVVKTKKEVDTLAVGGVLEVLATDPGSMADIRAWAKSTGNEVLAVEQTEQVVQGKPQKVFRFLIRRLK